MTVKITGMKTYATGNIIWVEGVSQMTKREIANKYKVPVKDVKKITLNIASVDRRRKVNPMNSILHGQKKVRL